MNSDEVLRKVHSKMLEITRDLSAYLDSNSLPPTPGDGWVEWHGGEEGPDFEIDAVQLRNGDSREYRNDVVWWNHKNNPGDIIRVHPVPKPDYSHLRGPVRVTWRNGSTGLRDARDAGLYGDGDNLITPWDSVHQMLEDGRWKSIEPLYTVTPPPLSEWPESRDVMVVCEHGVGWCTADWGVEVGKAYPYAAYYGTVRAIITRAEMEENER